MFKPTFLYIKQHTKTKKLYFGKTTKKNVEKYLGSGKRWKNHVNYHGIDCIETIWFCLYTDEITLCEQALALSKYMDIVASKDFMNLQEENGLDGMTPGMKVNSRKGFSTYKDSNGTKHFLHRDDPKIKELNLVGNNAGLIMAEDSRERMRIAKDAYRKITLHFMTYERTLYITDPEFAILIDYGWTPYTQQERHEESKLTRLTAQRKATQGKFQFSLPDGTFYGFLDIDDPKINELSLIKPIRSEKQIAQAQAQARANASNKEMQMRKGKTMSTRKWFHDPVNGVNRRLLECPIGWKDGRAESSESNKGKETWNDGIRNYMIRDRSEVQSNWTRGMAPRNSQN